MKYYYYLSYFLIYTWCIGCSSNTRNKNIIDSSTANGSDSSTKTRQEYVAYDTLYRDNDSLEIHQVHYFVDPPPITVLPFGYNLDKEDFNRSGAFFSKLCYPNEKEVNGKVVIGDPAPMYLLLPIKKLELISVKTEDTSKCDDGSDYSKYLKLTRYRLRLPDINDMQVYYWSDQGWGASLFPSNVTKKCEWCILTNSWGYLIFYQKKTQLAKVVPIQYETINDGALIDRYFYIDTNYDIHLWHTNRNNLDDIKTIITKADINREKYLLHVSKDNEISIKHIK